MSQEPSGGNPQNDIVEFIRFVVPFMKAMSVEEFKVDSLHVKFKSNQIQMTDYVDPLPVSVGMDDPEHNQHPEVQ